MTKDVKLKIADQIFQDLNCLTTGANIHQVRNMQQVVYGCKETCSLLKCEQCTHCHLDSAIERGRAYVVNYWRARVAGVGF